MWLLVQLHLYHLALPSFRYSAPISFLSLVFSTLSALSILQAVHSTCGCYNSTLRIQRSVALDPVDSSDLFLTFMGVALFNLIIIFLHVVINYHFYHYAWKGAARSFILSGHVKYSSNMDLTSNPRNLVALLLQFHAFPTVLIPIS